MLTIKGKMHSLSGYKEFLLLLLLLLSRETKYLWDNLWETYLDVEYHLLRYTVAENAIILVTWESTSTFLRLIYPEIRMHNPPFVSDNTCLP